MTPFRKWFGHCPLFRRFASPALSIFNNFGTLMLHLSASSTPFPHLFSQGCRLSCCLQICWYKRSCERCLWLCKLLILLLCCLSFHAIPSFRNSSYWWGTNRIIFQVKKAGRFKETKRTDGVSTSDIIMRIVKDYNEYVMRNLARGYTRKDLGVSYVKVRFSQ